MFNGQDLTGWSGSPDLWSVRDGVITGQTTEAKPARENTFLIWTNGSPADFEMRCSFRIEANNSVGFANSGVQYRSRVVKPSYWVVAGYQADMEAGPNYTGGLYEEKARGILASRGQKILIHSDGSKEVTGSLGTAAELQALIHPTKWNDYVIIARGNHLQQFINGHEMVDVIDQQGGANAFSGVIALQLHHGPSMTVQFKNLRIRMFDKKIVFVAGKPSHGHGEHEYRAGCLLLQKCLEDVPGITSVVYSNGWPSDPNAFQDASAVVLSMDGGPKSEMIEPAHLAQLGEAMQTSAGLACIHWAVEPTIEKGEKEFLQWLGGAFEINWSVNPVWTADFTDIPEHPVTRGVKPFSMRDEWYSHIRFPEGMRGVTPLLSAIAPESTTDRPDGSHSGNPAFRESVKNKVPQVVCWAFDRPDGGRGFGFTGAHYHKNYANDNFRKIVLNGLVWIAHGDVPPDGVNSAVTDEELRANLDRKKK